MSEPSGDVLGDLFRRESAHLIAALVRLLGPSRLALAEDVVQDALIAAMHAWRLGLPADPKAWLLTTARNRAIDAIRRERRLVAEAITDEPAIDLVLSPEADAANQLALMFALCDDTLGTETHVTLILRFLCGFSAAEIARAFLVDVGTIDRRLHRGRARLREIGVLVDPKSEPAIRARQRSVEHALYLLFSDGYHGTDPDQPLHPASCADALRLAELAIETSPIEAESMHALAALFCLDAARLPARRDDEGVILPLAEQDRSRFDPALIARGIAHLGASAGPSSWTRWHLEAGIALEHTRAPSVERTDWPRIVDYYDALHAIAPGPVVALNRALAIAQRDGVDAGRRALDALSSDERLASYSFHWAARADLARRAGDGLESRASYARAIALATSRAERDSYERRLRALDP